MEEVLWKADISEGINIDGEILTNLRFTDDVALSRVNKNNNNNKQMGKI